MPVSRREIKAIFKRDALRAVATTSEEAQKTLEKRTQEACGRIAGFSHSFHSTQPVERKVT